MKNDANANPILEIDHRDERESTRMQARKPLQIIARVNAFMRKAKSRDDVLHYLVDESIHIFSADAVGIYELHPNDFIYITGQGFSTPPPDRQPFHEKNILYEACQSDGIQFHETGKTPIEDNQLDQFLREQQVRSLLISLVRATQEAVFVLLVAFRRHEEFSPDIQFLLKAISEAAGNTLDRLTVTDQLNTVVENRDQELQVLYDLMSIASETTEIRDMLEKSLKRILQAAQCNIGIIHLLDPTDNQLKLAADERLSEGLLNYLIVSGVYKDLWVKVFETNTMSVINRLPDHRPFPEMAELQRLFYTYYGVPIHIKEKTIGVLSIFWNTDGPCSPMIPELVNSITDELGWAVESVHLRQQARDAVIIEERQHLAHNLHDSISQSLYTLVVLSDVSGKLLQIKDFSGLRQQLKDIGQMALQAVKEMRLMLYEFKPSRLEKEGLSSAIEERLNAVESRAGIKVNLKVGEHLELSPEMEQEIYRITNEALNNSLRHSGASHVSVAIDQVEDVLRLTVSDDGCGFDFSDNPATGGVGLTSMQDRANWLKGKLLIDTSPGQGTSVILEAPLHK